MPRKKKPLEVVNEEEKKSNEDTINNLRRIAKITSEHMNTQFREARSYVPNADKIASVTVSKWLELPEALSEGLELPGLPIGNITCVYGKPDSGKTSMLMQGIKACQDQGILPVLILTEHKFDFNRLPKFMNADPESLLVFHADSLEEGYAYVEKILRSIRDGKLVYADEEGNDQVLDVSENDFFIFWDSIGNTMSESELDYEVEEHAKSMGKGAKTIKTLTRRVNQLLGRVRQRCGIMFINQSYMSMPSYGPSIETPYGGDGIPYSSALVLRLRKKGKLKMQSSGKQVVIGLETEVQVVKNHITHKQPIFSVYTVAEGMIPAEKKSLEDFKKRHIK